MRRLSIVFSILALMGAVLFTASCGSGSSRLRVLEGSPFDPTVSILVNGTTVNSNLTYGTNTGYIALSSSTPHLQIQLPGSGNFAIDQTPSLSGDSTFVTVTSGGAFTGFVVADNNSAPSSGNANLRILAASANLPTGDVYILTPGSSIQGVNPTISSLAFQNGSAYQSLAPGTYQVVMAIPGTKVVAIEQNGTITLAAGQVRTLAALDTVNVSSGQFAILADVN